MRFDNSGLSASAVVARKSRWHQPGNWFRLDHVKRLGGFPEEFKYAFDWHFTVRYLEQHPAIVEIDRILVYFRLHPASKSVSAQALFDGEQEAVLALLSVDCASPGLQHQCREVLKNRRWAAYVQRVRSDVRSSRTVKVARISWGIAKSPAKRLNRMTLGAMRRIVSGQALPRPSSDD